MTSLQHHWNDDCERYTSQKAKHIIFQACELLYSSQNTYIYIYIHVYMHIQLFIYIYTYTCTHIHIYPYSTHIYIQCIYAYACIHIVITKHVEQAIHPQKYL